MIYTQNQMEDPADKSEYKAKTGGLQKSHNNAIADYYNPAEIKSTDVTRLLNERNKVITIHAADDLKR